MQKISIAITRIDEKTSANTDIKIIGDEEPPHPPKIYRVGEDEEISRWIR